MQPSKPVETAFIVGVNDRLRDESLVVHHTSRSSLRDRRRMNRGGGTRSSIGPIARSTIRRRSCSSPNLRRAGSPKKSPVRAQDCLVTGPTSECPFNCPQRRLNHKKTDNGATARTATAAIAIRTLLRASRLPRTSIVRCCNEVTVIFSAHLSPSQNNNGIVNP